MVKKETVRPKNFESLDYAAQRYYDELDSYQAPFVKEKLFLEHEFTSDEEYTEAFTELKKFVALARTYRKPLAMTSERIDSVWHQFILFTRQYHEFSNRFYGNYFHHTPNIPSQPMTYEPLENLIKLYHRNYGDLPEIWHICQTHKKVKV